MAAIAGVAGGAGGADRLAGGLARIGLVVCAGFCGLAFVLHLRRTRARLGGLRRWPTRVPFPLRHAVLHLSRPGNQTRVILLAVGLGAFFIVGVRSLQASLLEEFSVQVSADAPDMFLMDIQRDQAEGVRAFLRPATGGFRLIPVLRARVTVRVRETRSRARDVAHAARRASTPSPTAITSRRTNEWSTVVLGRALVRTRGLGRGRHRASVSRSTSATRFAFDILGRSVNARVTSIREVDWRDSRSGGFMFVFRPGVLDQAPQTFIAPLKGPQRACRARAVPARPRRAVPERVGHRLPRDSHHDPRHHRQGDARHHRRRRRSCCSAAR